MEVKCKDNMHRNIWFPVHKMFGGFNFFLSYKEDHYELISESWSRIADGLGQRHIITKSGTELIEEGFV